MIFPIKATVLAAIIDFKIACEEKEEEVDSSTNQQKLQKLQEHKRVFYTEKYLPLAEKFNEYGVSYIVKKKPVKDEHTLAQTYDTSELARIIKKHNSDIKVYYTITMMRCDVFFTRKINKKRRKEIHVMLDELHRLLAKKTVKANGKLKKEVENEFK